jgi:hypothetical protein
MRMPKRPIELIGTVALGLALCVLSIGQTASQDTDAIKRLQADVAKLNDRLDGLKSQIDTLSKLLESRSASNAAPEARQYASDTARRYRPYLLALRGTWIPQGTSQIVRIDNSYRYFRVEDSEYGVGRIDMSPDPADPGVDFVVWHDIIVRPGTVACSYSIRVTADSMYWTPGKKFSKECRPETEFRRDTKLTPVRHTDRCWPCYPRRWHRSRLYRPCWW